MPELGYSLSSEEHGPRDLVRFAKAAEDAGFTYALISDHYHPWADAQGNSSISARWRRVSSPSEPPYAMR